MLSAMNGYAAWWNMEANKVELVSSLLGLGLGPLVGLKLFHMTMLCHCSLHNVNLGICQDATGSTLLLVSTIVLFNSDFFWCF